MYRYDTSRVPSRLWGSLVHMYNLLRYGTTTPGLRLWTLNLKNPSLNLGGAWKSFFFCFQKHNILEPTMGLALFNNGFKSDPTKLFPFIILVTTC
jgi:hypothetical protein